MEENKKKLLREIQQCNFALVEANLYLDTHPEDQEAIQYFKKAQKRLSGHLAEFEEKYGKISANTDGKLRWAWVDEPWPWQMEG
ncbi:MAG: spore coat protein CotJB [Candidatus Merdivicinus sp.]|jgi:spore coat protein JB